MGKREEIAVLFPGTLREFIESCSLDFESMREIRLRAGRPVLLMYGNREYGFTEKGKPVELEPDNQKGLLRLLSDRSGRLQRSWEVFPCMRLRRSCARDFLPSAADTGSVWQEERC